MLEIRETQIEDILASHHDLTKKLLSLDDEISLISRQKKLPSGGILDLLFLSSNKLHLLELKIVPSNLEFCEQLIQYRDDLLILQRQDEMPDFPILSYLVCPEFLKRDEKFCFDNNLIPIKYSPYELLKSYYFRVKAISSLINLKPKNHGLWNLYLLNRLIYAIEEENNIKNLSKRVNLSESTVGSYLRLSTELGLTIRKQEIQLTDVGKKYLRKRVVNYPIDFISNDQCEILSDFIKKNPFFSPATFGIYAVVETIFALSKNFYPVPLEEARKFFLYLSGKQNLWAEKASREAFIMYSNYGIELGLLAKMNRNYYITPSGIKFILLLELNKSIIFVNSM